MSENKKDKRMIEILKSLDNPKENFKESVKEVNEEKILVEEKRLRDLATGHLNSEFKNENYYIAGNFRTGGQGKTVNSFIDSYQDTSTKKSPKVEPSNLKPEEALEISLKRSLKSGTPINNISFYDEVNWNLMNLGFPAVDALKIKARIIEMLGE